MSDGSDIKQLLVEIRDNQALALQRQEEQLQIARSQMARSQNQIDESVRLQREAVERFKKVARIAVPGIVLCIAMIVYLLVRYF